MYSIVLLTDLVGSALWYSQVLIHWMLYRHHDHTKLMAELLILRERYQNPSVKETFHLHVCFSQIIAVALVFVLCL